MTDSSVQSGFSPDISQPIPSIQQATVDFVAGLLEQTSCGNNAAKALSFAMSAIEKNCTSDTCGRIDLKSRDRLLRAIVRARSGIEQQLPCTYERASANAGMSALAYQIFLWAETPERTARRDAIWLVQISDDARIFRNDLHNMSPLKDKACRVRTRQIPKPSIARGR